MLSLSLKQVLSSVALVMHCNHNSGCEPAREVGPKRGLRVTFSRECMASRRLAKSTPGRAAREKGTLNMNIAIIPQSWTPTLQSVLRMTTGLLLLEHGTGKIFDFPDLSGMRQMLGPLFVPTGLIELIGGALILVGFLDSTDRVHPFRIHGRSLFLGAFSVGIFPGSEPRGTGASVLLRLSVFGRQRPRSLRN